MYGKTVETEEQNMARETTRLHRVASKSIKKSELKDKEAKLQTLQKALDEVNTKIGAEMKRAEDDAREKQQRMGARSKASLGAREARKAGKGPARAGRTCSKTCS